MYVYIYICIYLYLYLFICSFIYSFGQHCKPWPHFFLPKLDAPPSRGFVKHCIEVPYDYICNDDFNFLGNLGSRWQKELPRFWWFDKGGRGLPFCHIVLDIYIYIYVYIQYISLYIYIHMIILYNTYIYIYIILYRCTWQLELYIVIGVHGRKWTVDHGGDMCPLSAIWF